MQVDMCAGEINHMYLLDKQGTNTGLVQLFDTEAFNCGFVISNF